MKEKNMYIYLLYKEKTFKKYIDCSREHEIETHKL